MKIQNIYTDAVVPASGETFSALLSQQGLLIERIVSSPKIASTQYVQTQDEWVLLLQGEAEMDVAGERVLLAVGDYLFLPAQTPHTVLRVSDGAIWLAVHHQP
ncbi:cupin domain-containing protein [Deefgea sp. CFH1-16]|uniref:cupin domain-containing protein n=1 Tax=Deefgea sp. CFH1-16 TaxID=2675457 RepID=UPI0015F3B5CE|nr:cupin domain-containing protein [Deefgea sp. CFH1-16]MBM5574346.1 cupin domain-containing protein [Deefgea sp. CFH1-16]